MRRSATVAACFFTGALFAASSALGQAPGQYPPPQYGQPPPQYGQPPPQQYPQQYGQPPPAQYGQPSPQYGGPPQYSGPPPGAPPQKPAASSESSMFELGTLYTASVGYGIGLGMWLDSEIGITDPGAALIAPAILGVGAPVGVYFLDQPSMPRGKPSAIAAGFAIGGAEGLGIAGTQFVTASKEDAWGFRGLGRSVAIGATLGGVGGYFVGEFAEPSPKLSALVSSGALWGTMIGSSIAYGTSGKGIGYGNANDSAAVGGLVGMNVGLAATAGLSFAMVPSWHQIQGMWLGAGIGGAASLPVFLFYAGSSTPPAKRGLVFTGTAMTLGIVAGAIFSPSDDHDSEAKNAPDSHPERPTFARITSVVPMPMNGGAGLSVAGVLY